MNFDAAVHLTCLGFGLGFGLLGVWLFLKALYLRLCWSVLRDFLRKIEYRPFYHEELIAYITKRYDEPLPKMTNQILNLPGIIELGTDKYVFAIGAKLDES